MGIVEKIDRISGTNVRSKNITQAIDKLTGKGPSKNIEDAVKKMDSPNSPSSNQEPKPSSEE